VPAGGKENFHGGQVPAFDAEDGAGTGKCRFPGNTEMFTSEAVRRLDGDFWFFI
jgi:hypothetical protein